MTETPASALWHHHGPGLRTGLRGAPLVVAAIGVVFGDIGTSPIYTFSTVLSVIGSAEKTMVFGVASMIFWTITLIVSILYVRVLMRHDNDGEGGLLALLGLLRRSGASARLVSGATLVAIIGAALFFGDSVITPAISVLSAVEGLAIIAPGSSAAVVPVAVVLLIGLFFAQRFGTARIGGLFGPVMVLWFLVLILISAPEVIAHPGVLTALSPHWIVLLVLEHPWTAFAALTGVVLAVTGAEALFADMGHFGRRSITLGWFCLVYPALTLNYLAQASSVIGSAHTGSSVFFSLVPRWALIPVVIIATAATVIASQAVISGAFSVAQQAGRLRLLPPLRVVRVSAAARGQVYVPVVNVFLAVFVLIVTVAFGSSNALAGAYGIAVTITILTTAVLLLVLLFIGRARRTAGKLVAIVSVVVIALIAASNLTKIVSGGWLPIGIGLTLCLVMVSWSRGQVRLQESRRSLRRPLRELADTLGSNRGPRRVPGTAIFLSHLPDTVPSGLQLMLRYGHVVHEKVLIVSVRTGDQPFERHDEWTEHRGGLITLRIRLGYRMMARLPELLASSPAVTGTPEAAPSKLSLDDLSTALYVASQARPFAAETRGIPVWQRLIVAALLRAQPDPNDVFGLPRERSLLLISELPL